jgi:hypothetical protein
MYYGTDNYGFFPKEDFDFSRARRRREYRGYIIDNNISINIYLLHNILSNTTPLS